jgi:PAS domain S-box-containing protein
MPRVVRQTIDEKYFRLLVDSVTDYAIYVIDPDGRVATWSVGAERIKGYTAKEIIGQHFSRFFTEKDQAAGRPELALRTARETGRFEDEGWRQRKDGSRFWALAVLVALRDDRGKLIGFAKITRDMTERRAAQQALRESESRFKLLVENVVDYAIYMLDPEGRITNWNSGARQIKGYSANEVIGEHFSRFYTPEDREAGLPERALKTALEKGRYAADGWRIRKDGTRFWASVVVDPIYDEGGSHIGFAKITRDISEQREAQIKLEETREQLFQAQKMEAIGQLTGGVAHDFNNLLTIILGSADMAEALAGDNEKLRRLIGNVRHAARRGESLTKQLLAFSRRQPLQPEFVDLSRQLRIMSDLLARSLRADINIQLDIAPDLRPVEVDASQLELALLNVGLNARDAMPRGGTLRIGARNEGADRVMVVIEDTGIGMSPQVRERAIEPFFTTKGVGQGSGLGLSQAYGFAKQSGGMLTIASEIDKGTSVTFVLPAAQRRAAAATEDPVATVRRKGQATILLVEDDHALAELATGMLQGGGFTVFSVSNARAALDVLRSDRQIDLLISDIMMPDMNGAELARIVRRECPGVFILLSTGYAEAAASKIAQEFPLLRKPYGREALLAQVEKILGETGEPHAEAPAAVRA